MSYISSITDKQLAQYILSYSKEIYPKKNFLNVRYRTTFRDDTNVEMTADIYNGLKKLESLDCKFDDFFCSISGEHEEIDSSGSYFKFMIRALDPKGLNEDERREFYRQYVDRYNDRVMEIINSRENNNQL